MEQHGYSCSHLHAGTQNSDAARVRYGVLTDDDGRTLDWSGVDEPPARIRFQGHVYKLSGDYYRRNVWGSKGPSNLHRAVYVHAYGDISEGFEVHHREYRERGRFNNDPTNLEALDATEHQRQHMLERHANGTMRPPSDVARAAAAEWHKSPEGLAWHSQHGQRTWETRKWHEKSCEECGQLYCTPYPTRSKYCHVNCAHKALRRRNGKPVGVRPNHRKERLLSGKRRPSQQ